MEAEAVIEAAKRWERLALGAFRPEMDRLELEIESNHVKSVATRKKLAETTKQFRKVTETEEKLKRIGPLLRSYQEEIDSLTKRAKFADSAFRELYKTFYEVEDPSIYLNELVDTHQRLLDLETENERLRQEVEDNDEEFANLRNQDVTIRRLEEELSSLKTQMQEDVKSAREEKEKEMLAEIEARVREQQRSLDANRAEKTNLLAKVDELQGLLEKSQEELFESRTAFEESEATHQSELDLLSDDMHRANSQVAALEQELEQLRMSNGKSGRTSDYSKMDESSELDRKRVLELEDELIRKHELEESLRLQLSRSQADFEAQLQSSSKKENEFQASLKDLLDQIFGLKVQLNSRPTHEAYQKLKNQIQMLQAIDMGELDLGGDDMTGDSSGGDSDFDSKILIHGRIRKLEATATSLRVELSNCKNQLDEALREKAIVEERSKDQDEVIRKLEHGNQVIGTHSHSSRSLVGNQLGELVDVGFQGGPQDTTSAAQFLLAATEGVGVRDFSSEMSSSLTPRQGISGGGSNGDDSLLTIVHEQRNEFRKRMLELEAERDRLLSQLQAADQEIDSLKNDNVTLFEKIKYLQSYTHTSSSLQSAGTPSQGAQANRFDLERGVGKSSGGGNLRSTGSLRRLDSGEKVESKYMHLYEDRINPFTDFNARERRKRYKSLNPVERMTLNATSFFLSNKYTRSFVFFYAVALHFLVFLALFANTHSSCQSYTQHRAHDPHQFSPQHAALHAKKDLNPPGY